jgi:hypothetical protein
MKPLWLLLKNHVADIPESAHSLDALWDAVQKAWDGITIKDIQKHTN